MNIAFLGLGKMGRALAQGLLQTKQYPKIFAYDPLLRQEKEGTAVSTIGEGISLVKEPKELEEKAELLLLCVKPQDMPRALQGLKGNRYYISIAAGFPLSMLCYFLRTKTSSVARVMPNLAALVSHSINAIYCENEELFGLSKKIFDSVGYSFRVSKEEELHPLTGLSGSGPALVAAFAQALTEGAVLTGLRHEMALDISLKTIEGSIQLMKERQLSPSQLRQEVSSPAGVTIAALQKLEEGSFQGNIMAALEAALRRSKELEKNCKEGKK